MTSRSRAWLVAGSLSVLAVAGCTSHTDAGPSPSSSAPAAEPTLADLSPYTTQKVTWKQAGAEGYDTATIKVPVDYTDLSKGDTDLALIRVMSATGGNKDKWLVLNPGGPGGSGVDFAPQINALAKFTAPQLPEAYNFVGFDPRGVSDSDGLKCATATQIDQIVQGLVPTDEAEEDQAEDRSEDLAEGCEKTNGTQASHVTTVEAARDMDIIRALLGQDKLDYLGFSYGTYLGTTYAALFPDKVGRMVLDGAIDPNLSPMQAARMQAGGIETAFQAWAQNCLEAKKSCPVGSSVADIEKSVQGVFAKVDSEPLPTGDPKRPLTTSEAFYGIVDPLYSTEEWPKLTASLTAALAGDGSKLLARADDYFHRTKKGYSSNLFVADTVISSLDCQYQPQTAVGESDFVAASATFGSLVYQSSLPFDGGCTDYPLKTQVQAPDYTAPGAAPILVVGTSRDLATPLANSEALANTLSSGVLLTRDGDGHTAYLQDNECINTTVTAYLVDGTVPEDGKKC